MRTSTESSGTDKQGNYGWWHDALKKQQNLWLRGVHKALDIPEDEMSFEQNVRTGMGWRELAVIAAMLTGVGGAGAYIMNQSQTAAPPATVPAATSPLDSEYEVRFFDRRGNTIDVPRISERE